jgi:NAD(P)-dependent dehydrogenase (short-subunit alcohol dehydrogenase family)
MGLASADDIDLTDQVAVVTGGGRGIGRAIALGLATAGASVAVVARTQAEAAEVARQIGRAEGRSIAIPADVSLPSDVDRMIGEIERSLGPVDLLVNNAGLAGPIGPTWEIDPGEWWRCVEVNLRGPMLCTRAVLPHMVARRRGRIVNVASGAGTRAIPHFGAYVTSKAALIRFTEVVAAEVAENGVSAFSIQPGTVRTTMAESAMAAGAMRRWIPWLQDVFDRGEDVSPDHAARLVLLLGSGRADSLSGRFLTIEDDVLGMAEGRR